MTSGIMLYSDQYTGSPLTIPTGIDFVVSVAINDKQQPEAGFNMHMQEAYNAKIPNIALVNVTPQTYIPLFSLANPQWPDAKHDPYMIMMSKMFLAPDGISLLSVQGVILRISPADNKISGSWYADVLENLKNLIISTFKLPVYIMVDSGITKLYPNGGQDPQVYLSKQTMLCTYSPAPVTTGSLIPLPASNTSPAPNWNGIKLWWYNSATFDFLKNTPSPIAPILQYEGNIPALYKELNFIAPTVVTTPVVTTPVTTTGTVVDYTAVLARIENKIDILTAYVKSHVM